MARIIYINGESMISVQGPQGSSIAGNVQLGLAVEAVEVRLMIHSEPVIVDAYGKGNPVDEQVFGGEATIQMTLVDFNPTALQECVRLSFPGSALEGQLGRAGFLRGGAVALGTAGSTYINLNIASPVAGLPYNFPATYLRDEPYRFPLGTTRSMVTLTWKALAYSADPWNGGTGSQNVVLYNRVLNVASS